MAEDPMDSDSSTVSKRKIATTHSEQEEEEGTHLLQHSLPLHPNQEEEATMDETSPKKKAKCFPLLSEANQEQLGPLPSTQKPSLSGSFEQGKKDDVDNSQESCFGVEEADKEKRVVKGSAFEPETVLDAEKKRLLAELDVGKIFGAKIDDGNHIGGIGGGGGLSLPVRRGALKISVIDDTALIEPLPLSEAGNGCGSDERKKGKQEVDGKKAKRSRRKGKNARKALGGVEKCVDLTNTGKKEGNTEGKIMYSREELEGLRFAKVVEQRKLWKNVYEGMAPAVKREYEDLAFRKNQMNTRWSSDTRHRFGSKAESPALMGEEYSENRDNEIEYMEDNQTENVYQSDLTCTHDVGVEDAVFDEEEEYIEDDDSDDDYNSILKPAFMVEGEPDFDSGPPEDGLEYLRRVRWEAAQIPNIKIAKPDRSKLNKEQSVYMPQIPEIAKCPEHLLPSKQWEDEFLADFSKLRLTLSPLEDPSAGISCILPKFTVQAEDLCQLPESIVLEKFNDLTTSKNHSEPTSLSDAADSEILPSHQNLIAKTSVSDACDDYPTLSAIRKMDSVARVSMLRKRINSFENMASLSRSNGVWLFALCAAVDTPLDADTSASLRSLLRKCANLRAGKSELDDEVVMLNILATISGRYFGQSET